MLWKSSLSLISTWIKRLYNDYGSEGDEYNAFLSQSERWPKPWKVVLTFESVDKIYDLTIQMKPLQQYFHIYVFLTFESMDEILWCDHSNETSSEVLSHGTIYIVCFSNFRRNLWCDHSNETPLVVLSHVAICFPAFYEIKFGLFAIIIFLCIQVYVVLHGEGQMSNPIELKCEGRHLFQRSSCDVFVVR